MKKTLTRISHIKKNKKIVSLYFIVILLAMVSVFAITKNSTIHSSELNFKEYSVLGKQAGSVIPASCVSGVHITHNYDINTDYTIDSGCIPTCGSGTSLQTTKNYRCYYYKAPSNGQCLVTGEFNFCEVYQIIPSGITYTAWQATIPSCPPGTYGSITGGSISYPSSGDVQQKNVYSCVANPTVNIQFQ